ncbi:hypothetical protein ASE48_27100 [Mycobacterium sp. Root265]|uniref:hypothetical protein n=1 Tax=Mycobacterium sp. Root265 TaxID=1736504 RepID=UPI000708DC30|nr:hypothetical protein [Mycobacterium sp. Root265]KRD16834.1 hypothetical protein ASE48_27100 [Mycobacterium sp. Root265]
MKIVNDQSAVPVRLAEASTAGYLVLAAEIGTWAGPFALPSRTRGHTLARAVQLCAELAERDDVLEAVVFRGALRPPGEGADILARAGARPARFDVVVLILTRGRDDLDAVRGDAAYRALSAEISSTAKYSYRVGADNAARIADVDHRSDDWFLFNYFHCDDADTVYSVWRYTAGWFQQRTALPNSTLLRPLPRQDRDFSVVNHASWPTLRTFLPALLLRPSFRTFVLANFAANGVAAQPIMYRRVPRAAGSGH